MLYIIFLVLAFIFLLLKIGIFKISLNLGFDIIHFDILFLKIRVRISAVTALITAAWFTGLNEVVSQYVTIPVWAVLLIIFVGLPTFAETIFGKKERKKE